MNVLLSFLGSGIAKLFADKVLGWIALKGLLVFLFITIVPLVLNNFLYDIIKIMMDFASSASGQASTLDGSMDFTGFAAFLIECFRLPEAFSLLVSSLCLRLILNLIPFVRLVG